MAGTRCRHRLGRTRHVVGDSDRRDAGRCAERTPRAERVVAAEYGLHTAFVTAMLRDGIERLLAGERVEPPDVDDGPGEPLTLDVAQVIADIEREGAALASLGRDPRMASHRLATAAYVHAAHDATHHFMDVGRGLAAARPGHQGRVAQINASSGGVPKLPIEKAVVTVDGLEGDVQADRKHHGRPFQALSLWSTEVLGELAAQGHPIGPGCAGENITLSGIDWASMRPGVRLRIGTLLAEVSYPAVPCAKQTRWFTDGDFNRISHERNPHWVRWYAWVREPGAIVTGDEVTRA